MSLEVKKPLVAWHCSYIAGEWKEQQFGNKSCVHLICQKLIGRWEESAKLMFEQVFII